VCSFFESHFFFFPLTMLRHLLGPGSPNSPLPPGVRELADADSDGALDGCLRDASNDHPLGGGGGGVTRGRATTTAGKVLRRRRKASHSRGPTAGHSAAPGATGGDRRDNDHGARDYTDDDDYSNASRGRRRDDYGQHGHAAASENIRSPPVTLSQAIRAAPAPAPLPPKTPRIDRDADRKLVITSARGDFEHVQDILQTRVGDNGLRAKLTTRL
jgi:hypothetical protein